MKKMFLIFALFVFANSNFAKGAYFYADAVEQAIQQEFAPELQSVVASEYEAQMTANGYIDTAGFENVCYAGGYNVAAEEGSKKCENFKKRIVNTCVYAKSAGLVHYTNPATEEEKIRKCVFDKTMDYVFSWEKGFQQSKTDSGNRICDGNGNPKKDKNGDFLLGATNHGVTTCASGLSVSCIKKMTQEDAKKYYWTRFYWKYGYHRLPVEALGAVMELAVGGTRTVADELRSVVPNQCEKNNVISDCVAQAVQAYIDENGVDVFYEKMSNARARKRSGKSKTRAEGITELAHAHEECAK